MPPVLTNLQFSLSESGIQQIMNVCRFCSVLDRIAVVSPGFFSPVSTVSERRLEHCWTPAIPEWPRSSWAWASEEREMDF